MEQWTFGCLQKSQHHQHLVNTCFSYFFSRLLSTIWVNIKRICFISTSRFIIFWRNYLVARQWCSTHPHPLWDVNNNSSPNINNNDYPSWWWQERLLISWPRRSWTLGFQSTPKRNLRLSKALKKKWLHYTQTTTRPSTSKFYSTYIQWPKFKQSFLNYHFDEFGGL